MWSQAIIVLFVDLTSTQLEARIYNEKDGKLKHVCDIIYVNPGTDQPHQQVKNNCDKLPVENKSTELQNSAVLSIKISKVQEDVEWENGGKKTFSI